MKLGVGIGVKIISIDLSCLMNLTSGSQDPLQHVVV